MTYKAWLQEFMIACNADMPTPVYQWSAEYFPTINLRMFYQQGFAPERAATIAKGINRFTKPKYIGKKESPIYQSPLQSI